MFRATALAALAVILVAAGTGQASDSRSDMRREVAEAWDTIAEYSAEQKDKAVEKGEEIVGNLDRAIADLGEEAREAKGDAKVALERRTEELKELRAESATRLDGLRESTADRWDTAKAAFGDAVDAFRKRWSEATGD
ncbi:MAG: hypothetical protein VYB54_10155 [Pseudomonadota bacterium]|nr:hypothetical protein [Pseudomonadota bacterium]